jgi:predicted dehydrogenase
MHPVSTSGKKIRFGLIGTGRIADAYAQAFAAAGNAILVGVTDILPMAAQAFAAKNHCQSFDTYEDLLKGVDVDAVVVSTPPVTHGPICVDLLSRGIAVLCEKPVSLDVETARAIRDASAEHGALFTMASKFRYVEDVARAKSIVNSGILGNIVLFENTFMSRVDMRGRWNSDVSVGGGGVLIDNGTHSVDIMRYFLGPLKEIYVMEGNRSQGLPVEETVRVLVRGTSDVMGSVDLSWSLNKEIDHYVAIYGSHGTLRLGWKSSTYKQAGSSDWVVFGNGYDKVMTFRRQIENFSGAILGTEPLLINVDDAIASVEAIQAGYRALRGRCWSSVGNVEKFERKFPAAATA